MARHPHADLIKEWAEDVDKVVQFKSLNGSWHDVLHLHLWCPTFEYRFKPEPKPDVVEYMQIFTDEIRFVGHIWTARQPGDNLKLTFDGETGKLISAEVIE